MLRARVLRQPSKLPTFGAGFNPTIPQFPFLALRPFPKLLCPRRLTTLRAADVRCLVSNANVRMSGTGTGAWHAVQNLPPLKIFGCQKKELRCDSPVS